MGDLVRIAQLAAKMIRLNCMTVKNKTSPDADIAFEGTGYAQVKVV